MRATTILAAIQGGVVILQRFLDVVCIQNRDARGFGHALPPQHHDIAVGDWQDQCAAVGGSGYRMYSLLASGFDQRVARQKRHQMFCDTDWSHAGAASAVRDRKGLVQIQMTYICANVARTGESDLCVHVCAVHIDLSAIGVDDAGDLGDALLVDAMCARVCDHQAGQIVLVLLCLFAQISHVDISLLVALHEHDFHSAHRSAGRIGAMRGGGDQCDVAAHVAT